MEPRTIIAFGHHDQRAPRHWNITRRLEQDDWKVVECHTTRRGFLKKCLHLIRQWRNERNAADAILVTFPGHFLIPLAWILTRVPRKKLIFDAFISLYDTIVDDRKLVGRWHPYAWFLFIVDWVSCHLADEVLIDTEEQKKLFVQQFRLSRNRVTVVYLGARTDLFSPAPVPKKRTEILEVFFYGNYIPLQGVDIILEAAMILEKNRAPVHFTFVGGGQLSKQIRDLATQSQLKSITFIPFVPLEELPELIRRADLCLGIFGTTNKAARVIPHKVFDAVACRVPVITRDSPAIKEIFANHPLVLLCPPGDPHSLASRIQAFL